MAYVCVQDGCECAAFSSKKQLLIHFWNNHVAEAGNHPDKEVNEDLSLWHAPDDTRIVDEDDVDMTLREFLETLD